jgi:putative ABC transport system permease protein
MFKTHLKFAVRVFLKDKFFSVLNVLGLALGIAVSIILLLILQHDLTYDKYHVNHKRIYRLGGHLWATGIDVRQARTARELGAILKEELPEVLEVVRANNWDHTLVTYEKDNANKVAFYEEDIVRTDSTFFDVFTHEFIAGDPKSCLKELNTLVITESIAKKYFGNDDAIGQTLRIDGGSWKVTAVIKDVPENTHLKFNILLSRLVDRDWVRDEGKLKSEAFWNPDVYTYLLFPADYNPADFHAKFSNIYDKYFKSFGDQVGGHYEPILEPLADIHFHSQLAGDEAHGNMAYLYAFTGIGIMIIILACINYMNLSTAKSVTRATEIAMKKTLGSGRRALVLSVLFESVFLSMASLATGVVLVFVILKATSFNQLIGKNLAPDFFNNPVLLFGSIAIALGIGIVAGLYPAFYLPSIPTLKALKGSFKNRRSSHTLRRILIATQFAISIFVVVCTMFMQDQIDYVRNRELGFQKDNVLLLPIQDTTVQKQIHAIKNDFLQNPAISQATTSYNVMGMNVGGGPVMWAEAETGMKQQQFTMMVVGDKYLETMGMDLLQGRNFKEGANADVDDVFIVNQAAAKLMGWKDVVGKKMKFFHGERDGQVIGLVKDFNFSSLHNAVAPLIIIKAREEGGFLHLKVKGENLPETLAMVRDKWSKLDPYHPFEYFFLDERFNEQYKEDEVQYKLLSGLSYVCIFISLLGLLGLSAFSATQRTKEIGIRKVHGASVPSIIYLLYKDVMLLVIISAICVIPVSYYMISQWMSNFAYQTEINYFVFATVAALALLFAFCTVAFHSMKTARTNPVSALKYE